MTLQLALIILNILFVLLLLTITIIAARFFKKHEHFYQQLLSEYRQNGYDLDLVTNYASFLGSFVSHFKIIYFIRLYKGVKMKFNKERNVQPEAYVFIQQLPQEKIGWMLKLHRLHMIEYSIAILWFCEMLIYRYYFG